MPRFISDNLFQQLEDALHTASMCDHSLVEPALKALQAVPNLLSEGQNRINRLSARPSGDYIYDKEIQHINFHLQEIQTGIASFAYLSQLLQLVPDGEYDPRKHNSFPTEESDSDG